MLSELGMPLLLEVEDVVPFRHAIPGYPRRAHAEALGDVELPCAH